MLVFVLLLAATCLVSAGSTLKPTPKPTGAACWKRFEYRGQGIDPELNTFYMQYCPNKAYPELSRGRCYPKCETLGFQGTGATCWQTCPKTQSNGVYFCCDYTKTCLSLERRLAITIPADLKRLTQDLINDPTNIHQIMNDFRILAHDITQLKLPFCPKPTLQPTRFPTSKPTSKSPTRKDLSELEQAAQVA